MNILLHDYLVIKPLVEEVTKGGIILAAQVQDKQMKGEVVLVGKDVDDEDIKVGTIVLFDKMNSTAAPKELGEDNKLCQYEDLLAILS